MSGSPQLRSSLAPFGHLANDPDPDAAWKLAEDAWHDHGVPVFILPLVDQKRGWSTARRARQLAEEVFGKRKGGQA